MLIHTDYDSVGLKGMLRQQAAAASDGGTADEPTMPVGARTSRIPKLAAYNARLAELAAQGPKTWRARESVVVRREQ